MRNLIKNERFILIGYLLVFVPTLIILLMFEKTQIHMFVNRNSNQTLDFLFKHLTLLGDGWIIVFICLSLLLYKYKTAITQAMAYALSGITAQLLKHLVFSNSMRPNLYFKNFPEYTLRLVDGVNVANSHSFPSGHTASAFAMFFVFIFIIKNKLLKTILLCLAILVGYSRIYLSQHFMIDVAFGSLIGVLAAIISFVFMNRYDRQLNNSLINKVS